MAGFLEMYSNTVNLFWSFLRILISGSGESARLCLRLWTSKSQPGKGCVGASQGFLNCPPRPAPVQLANKSRQNYGLCWQYESFCKFLGHQAGEKADAARGGGGAGSGVARWQCNFSSNFIQPLEIKNSWNNFLKTEFKKKLESSSPSKFQEAPLCMEREFN